MLKLETGYTSAVFFPGGGAFGSLIVSKPPFRAARRKNIKGSKIKYSEIELRNGTKIYEIHTLPPAGSVLAADRDTSLAYMANIIAADAAKNKILVGDLNITPYTYQFSRLEQTSQLTNSMRGFKQLRGTWPTMYNIVNRIPIDHLLVSKNISVVDREIGPDLGSDHFPVMTRLLISE